MNHDYAHCADFTEKCPRQCFRAKLQRDLKKNYADYIGIPISYVHFRESNMCQMDLEGENDDSVDT